MELDLDKMILDSFAESASDLFVKSDSLPSIRKHGKITRLEGYGELSFDQVKESGVQQNDAAPAGDVRAAP